MKAFFSFLVIVICVNPLMYAQLAITAFPFASRNFDVKSLSLGNATVSLAGAYSDENINPAGIGVNGTLQLSPDWSAHVQPLRLDWHEYEFYGDYKFGNSAVAISAQRMETGEQITSLGYPTGYEYKFNNHEIFASTDYSHEFKNKLRFGASVNYLYSSEASGTSVSAIKVPEVDTWSIDLGLQYQFSKKVDEVVLIPSFGLALTNFGKPVEYFGIYRAAAAPLSTKLHAGVGFTLKSTSTLFDQEFVKITLLQNASKLMARLEVKTSRSDTSLVFMKPFKALIKSWDEYSYFDGQQTVSSSLIEQIWWHSGIELTFLETVSLRWGYEKAGKQEEQLSYRSIGVGIDLYYLALDYAYISDTYADYSYGNYFNGSHWQLTGRIPLDGKTPDTILHHLF